jgi:hypothetical protein
VFLLQVCNVIGKLLLAGLAASAAAAVQSPSDGCLTVVMLAQLAYVTKMGVENLQTKGLEVMLHTMLYGCELLSPRNCGSMARSRDLVSLHTPVVVKSQLAVFDQPTYLQL